MASKRLEISKAINAVLSSYAPTRVRFELEEWVLDLLRNLKANEIMEVYETNFKYNEIYITFLQAKSIFNLTRIDNKGILHEASLSFGEFLRQNYGVKTLLDLDLAVNFSDCDLELMAMQLTDIIIDWGEYPLMMSCLNPLVDHSRKSANP